MSILTRTEFKKLRADTDAHNLCSFYEESDTLYICPDILNKRLKTFCKYRKLQNGGYQEEIVTQEECKNLPYYRFEGTHKKCFELFLAIEYCSRSHIDKELSNNIDFTPFINETVKEFQNNDCKIFKKWCQSIGDYLRKLNINVEPTDNYEFDMSENIIKIVCMISGQRFDTINRDEYKEYLQVDHVAVRLAKFAQLRNYERHKDIIAIVNDRNMHKGFFLELNTLDLVIWYLLVTAMKKLIVFLRQKKFKDKNNRYINSL